jgi:LuxR family maltose regulon positive regulatory protein
MLPKILTTKLQVPRLPIAVIRRPRLTARLQAGLDRKLTVLCAPAGYGKTTLLSEWLAQYELSAAWLSLDQGDNVPARLYAHLTAALRTVSTDRGDSLPTQASRRAPSSFQPVLAELIGQIESLQKPLLLVLDGFELLENATIHADIALLLNNIPSQLHVILISRYQPPLPLARLRVHDELNELGTQDLLFSYEEAQDYFTRVCGYELSAAQIASLHSATEGWIDGLQMAARALRGLEAAQRSHVISEFNSGHQYVADYLTEEVMNQQPEHIRTFLMQVSVLSQLNGSLCQAVTGEPHAHKLLERLAEQNSFITAVDEHREWYRFHQLFGKYLEYHLRQTQPDLIPELHRRASRWYERHGLANAAVQHAMAGQDWQLATRLIAETAEAMALKSQYAKVHTYLGQLPAESSPLGATSHTEADPASGPSGEQVRGSAAAGHRGGMGALIAGKVLLVDGQADRANQVLAGIDLANVEFSGESEKLTLIGTLGEMYLQQGKLHQAAATYEPFLDLAVGQCAEPFWREFQRGLCRLYYTWNRVSKAEHLARQCLATFEQVGSEHVWLTEAYLWLARIEQAQGQEKAADTALHQALMLARISSEPTYMAQATLHGVQLCLQRGEQTVPARWLKECGLTPNDPVPYSNQAGYLTLARVLIRQHRPDPALSLLKRMFDAAESAGRKGDLIEVLALQALAYEAKADVKRAFAMLANALCQAEHEGVVRTFVDEGAPMATLLQRAAQQGVTVAYVKDLLSAFSHVGPGYQDSPKSPDASLESVEALVEPLSARELEVLRLVAAGHSNQETADVLQISPTTVKKHLSNILGKLNTKNRTEAAAKAQRLHLI